MSAASGTSGSARVKFRAGARLTSRDLGAATDHERRLHGLHVRALHDTWGIALGYDTALDATRREVRVGPGLAYDCNGEELLLGDAVALPGPKVENDEPVVFDLILREAPALGQPAADARAVACIAGGTRAPVSITWARVGRESLGDRLPLLAPGVRLGVEVPLGRFVLDVDGSLTGPDPFVRRKVRPLLRPHVSSGRAAGQQPDCKGLLCTLTIDTKSAGFNGIPLYFASIVPDSLVLPGAGQLLVGPMVSIAKARKDELTVQFVFALRPSAITDTAALEASIKVALGKAQVDWVGVEPFGGCPPDPAGRLFVRLGGWFVTDYASWPGLMQVMAMAGGVT